MWSRRSSASKVPSWSTSSAPRDQGPTSACQIESAEPGCAGHQTASPRPASSQCSAATRAAKTAPWECPTSFAAPAVPGVSSTKAISRDDESLRRPRRRAGDDDGAHLEAGERDLDPVDVRACEDEDGVAGTDAAFAQERRPARRPLREDVEGARFDDPVLADEGDRAPLGIVGKGLDDVTREVEPVRDLPAALRERGIERELER